MEDGVPTLVVPEDAQNPFSAQSMQVVVDRLQHTRIQDKFLLGREILRRGVFTTTARFSSDKAHKHFMASHMMAVADKHGDTSMLSHATFDRVSKQYGTRASAPPRALPRNGKVIASREGVSKFLAELSRLPPNSKFAGTSLELEHTAYYWEYYHPQATSQLFVHPYIDLDIETDMKDESKFNEIYNLVDIARRLTSKAILAKCGLENTEVLVLYCKRPSIKKANVTKHSFHLHWPGVVIDDMSSLSALVRSVSDQCPYQPDGKTNLIDLQPYGSNQLLRGPYCGKLGEGRAAMLVPIRITSYRTTSGKPFYGFAEDMHTPRWQTISKACIATLFGDNYTRVVVNPVPRLLPRAVHTNLLPASEENAVNFSKWMGFWLPVLQRFVVPNFIRFRQQQAGVLGVTASFPSIDESLLFSISDIQRIRNYPASFCITIEGDTFCEYDSAHGARSPYVHSFGSNAISYVVDLHKGKMYQQCLKCRPAADAINWYSFIKYDDLHFRVMDSKVSETESTDFVAVQKGTTHHIGFFMQFYYDQIVYARDIKQVMVYDKTSGEWKNGQDGNGLILQLVYDLNAVYRSYAEARNAHILEKTYSVWLNGNAGQNATDEEKTTQREKCVAACKKANQKIGVIWHLTQQSRATLLKSLAPEAHPHQVAAMEPHAHLVPLSERKCLDVFTWHQREIQPTDYFVSRLNASIVNVEEEDVLDFTDWQRQVCCGDDAYLQYKLRIMGLSLTMFNFDRSFYMPLGPVGRNGKSSESFLFNEVTMKNTPARGYYMSREYLTKQGQDRKGANAADTVMMDLANKTIIIADECRDTQLDGALIKTLVSGDRTSGRNLYEAERSNIHNKGKLWVIANKTLKLDYTDKALMDRLVMLPYNARWVPDPQAIKAKLPDLSQREWIFQDDPYFKEKKLQKWTSAMVTKCLYELHLFFSSMQRDDDNPDRPAKLQRIPVPKSIQRFTRETIEHEHPVLIFIRTYMKQTSVVGEYVTVEYAFSQFMRFGKNENSIRIRHMNRSSFQQAMLKEDMDVSRDDNGVSVFKGWKMKMDVPVLEQNGSDAPAAEGFFYQPPPAEPPAKRQCLPYSD